MGILGQRKKNGVRYVTFGCTAHKTRGSAICPNALSVSELKLNSGIIGALRDALTREGVVERFVARFNRSLAAKKPDASQGAKALDNEISTSETAVRNITDALARVGYSEALASRLQEEEARLLGHRERRAAAASQQVRSSALPHPKLIESYLTEFFKAIEAKPERAREMLKLHIGELPLVPKKENPGRHFYVATGVFDLGPIPLDGRYSENRVAGAGFEPATFGL